MEKHNENENGKFTIKEIISQPEAWVDAIRTIEKHKKTFEKIDLSEFDQVLFTGCGSTYYLSLAASSLFQQLTNHISKAVPASELLLNPDVVYIQKKTLLIAVSRSGSTTETVKAVEHFRKQEGGFIISLTNYPNQPLDTQADLPLIIHKGQEGSVAQTRSFASLFVAATALAICFSPQEKWFELLYRLPCVGERIISKYNQYAQAIGENLNIDRYYFLGCGARYGLCCETNLKMKEMSLTHSESFHFLEFRHGPMAMVTPTTNIIGLLSESNYAYENQVLDDMRHLGAKIIRLAEKNADIEFLSGIPEPLRNVLYLPVLQLMAYYRSMMKGLNPDRPKNLNAVVNLNL